MTGQGTGWTLDCNGMLDDDCEVTLGTDDNCTACGDQCRDPAKPCIFDESTGTGSCGCGAGRLFCEGVGCVDPKADDEHCGGCGNACDPTGDGAEIRPNTYYGCSGGTCGHVKCENRYEDCDQDRANGCEVSLLSPTNCGACDNVCDANQSCELNSRNIPECMCPPGQTFCPNRRSCVDLRVDPDNCGACGTVCFLHGPADHAAGVCNYGSCTLQCAQGWGNCNGDQRDGCEVNLNSDPRNCGACGNACEPGQPCVGGRCAIEPCSEGSGAR